MRIAATRWLCACLALAGVVCAQQSATPWREVLGTPRGELPEPQPSVEWRTDLADAFEEARETGRPLFVTLRCLPCKQCSSFDKEVLEGGATLTPLLRQFVTVRLTNAMDLDLSRLPAIGFQDFDMSWWGYFLSDTAQLYGVFGGRDHVSDATRISERALANSLRRVLQHHYDPRRASWAVDGEGVAPKTPSRPPSKLPGFASFAKRNEEFRTQTCLHCHQVADVVRQPEIDLGTFDKQNGTNVWPLPENVGITLDRDDGLLVTAVEHDSPAAKAGIEVGDRLGTAGGRRLFGQADFRGVLHRSADPAGKVSVRWLRGGEVRSGVLELREGWRRTVLDWRMSISQGNIGIGPTFFPLRSKRRDAPKDAMAIEPFFGRHAKKRRAFQAGIRPSHVVVAVDGQRPRLHGRAFLVWFRKRVDPGQRVVFTVLDNGKERDIPVVMPTR